MEKRAFRVFLDSNVILSGLLSDKGVPRIILDILSLRLPFLIGLTGKYNLLEIERNLTKKLPALATIYRRYLPRLKLKVIPLPQSGDLGEFSGSIADKDLPVLVSAIQGKADFLVTGDKRHFQKLKASRLSLQIVSPSEFVDLIMPDILKKVGETEKSGIS